MKLATLLLVLGIGFGTMPSPAHAQFPFGDWGDAPDGWAAYWDNGAGGRFPTCSVNWYAYHDIPPLGIADDCYFGMNVDEEWTGNANICSEPHERDECAWQLDGDAGLIMPTAYTYGPTRQLITCSGLPPTSLGQKCTMVRWGRDIDINITNNLPGNLTAYLNILIDWDRSGDWSVFPVGPSGCGAQIAEHVVRNMPVQPGFTGRASQLGLADFQVGPDTGVVWVRFQISEQQVMFPYAGQGHFEYGETEDYLLHVAAPVADHELGDAPQGVEAYPGAGPVVIGQYPTCVSTPNRVLHSFNNQIFLGPGSDGEEDGNHDECAFNVYDHDECFQDGDAGLLVPRPYTLNAAGTNIQTCAGPGTTMGPGCQPILWGADLDLTYTNNTPSPVYLNMLVDWDRNGSWGNTTATCPSGPLAEHVIQNFTVAPGSGTISALALPMVMKGGDGFVWTRFTISDVPVPANWDGGGDLGEGETEDYLLVVGPAPTTDVPVRAGVASVGPAWPNPARGPVSLDCTLAAPANVSATVFDLNGRQVGDLGGGWRGAGSSRLRWDGRTRHGAAAPSGVYYVHVRIGEETHVRQVLLLH